MIEGFMSDCMITKWYQLKDLDIKVLSDDLMLLDGKIYYLSILTSHLLSIKIIYK